MNKEKSSYYASHVAVFCGVFLLIMQINYLQNFSLTHTVMAFLFMGIGFVGLKKTRK